MRTPCYHPRIRLGRTAGLTGCPSANRHLNHAFGQASFLCQRSSAPSTAAPQTRAQDCEKVLVWGVYTSGSASRNGRDAGNTIVSEGFRQLSPEAFRGYTPDKIGVLGSRIPLDNLRRTLPLSRDEARPSLALRIQAICMDERDHRDNDSDSPTMPGTRAPGDVVHQKESCWVIFSQLLGECGE